jgi:hypothetical protein
MEWKLPEIVLICEIGVQVNLWKRAKKSKHILSLSGTVDCKKCTHSGLGDALFGLLVKICFVYISQIINRKA